MYPAFPVSGSKPAFLDPFDPGFMTAESTQSIYGFVQGGAPPLPPTSGGAVITEGEWKGLPYTNPRRAIFGWAFINILQLNGEVLVPVSTPLLYPQIIGPRFAWITLDPGGVQILT